MSETTKPEHQVRRSGLKSTEFWLSILALAASTILPVVVDEIGKLVASSPYSALTPAIIAAGYSISRALVKKSRNDASATVAAKEDCDDPKLSLSLFNPVTPNPDRFAFAEDMQVSDLPRVLDDFTGDGGDGIASYTADIISAQERGENGIG